MHLRRAEHRLLRRRHRTAEPARRAETQSVAARSTPSSRCSTAAAARGSCATSSACCRPGDILKCALALARNEREARRVLLARLPTLEHARLGGHTGGNLLLSMMQRYSGDFLAAVDGLRALLGCRGRVWPVSVEQASVCAEYGDGSRTRGEVEVDAGQTPGSAITRLWLEPPVRLHPAVDEGDPRVRRRDHRARQLLHQPDADLSGRGRARGDSRR